MTKQLKDDLKTIIQILSSILITYALIEFSSKYPLARFLIIAYYIVVLIYNFYHSYFLRYRKDVVLFPTVNDQSSKMTYISIGVLILLLCAISYFAFTPNIYLVFVGLGFCVLSFLLGFFQSPKGWIKINNNLLKVYGVKDNIDTRQLKAITLANDKITLTNVYDENKNSFQLKLDPSAAMNIKNFLTQNLPNKEILIVDNVTNLD